MVVNDNFVSPEARKMAREVASLNVLRSMYARARDNVSFYEEFEQDDKMVEYWRHYMALCQESAVLVKQREQYKFNAEWIKSKIDIVEYIGRHTRLFKSGFGKYSGLCIFHNDTHPSLFVYSERQDWYCYGCLTGGDLFNFAMLYYGRDFKEVLPILASEV